MNGVCSVPSSPQLLMRDNALPYVQHRNDRINRQKDEIASIQGKLPRAHAMSVSSSFDVLPVRWLAGALAAVYMILCSSNWQMPLLLSTEDYEKAQNEHIAFKQKHEIRVAELQQRIKSQEVNFDAAIESKDSECEAKLRNLEAASEVKESCPAPLRSRNLWTTPSLDTLTTDPSMRCRQVKASEERLKTEIRKMKDNYDERYAFAARCPDLTEA
eukprot:3435444-Rhodomonas_salina.1